MLKKWLIILIFPSLLIADSEVVPIAPELEWEEPWFTGPLLASSATVVPIGHWNTEPYVTFTNTPARYDNEWKTHKYVSFEQVSFEPFFWVGLTDWLDLQILPAWSWNYRDGPARWVFNDFSAKIDIQLHRDQLPHKSWLPSIKFGFQEIFPTGKYNNLDPQKQYTDQGGSGSYVSTFQIAIARIFHVYNEQWLQLRLNVDYGIPTSVHVKGLNAYGGGEGTDGYIRPGQQFSFDAAFEYTLTRHWALACDFVGAFQGRGHFSGHSGRNIDGTPVINTSRPSIQYSLAPAIEYNFNDSIGIIAGSWFTLAGKNSSKFSSAIIALNYYYQ